MIILNQSNTSSEAFSKNGGTIYGTIDKASVFGGATLWLTEETAENHPTLARKIQNDTQITDLKSFKIVSIGKYTLFLQNASATTNIIININY